MFVTDDTQERSPYWLSPGIDVPTRDEILPGMRSAKGLFHICDEHAEGAFVPTDAFMRNRPRGGWTCWATSDRPAAPSSTRRWSCSASCRGRTRRWGSSGSSTGFRHACEQLGLVLPENVEALIVLDRQFTPGRRSEPLVRRQYAVPSTAATERVPGSHGAQP